MAPDGVVAQDAAAGLVALAGVDRLEGVDVAVGLVEVAVAVEVVAVADLSNWLRYASISAGVLPAAIWRVVPAVASSP